MFPDVPLAVFDMFFKPLIINDIGWPFLTINDTLNGTDWYRILFPFTLRDLQQLKWRLSKVIFDKDIFHPVTKADIRLVIENSVFNYGALIRGYPKDSGTRLKWHKEFIKTARNFCTPIVLASSSDGLKLLDGHHRLAALFMLDLENTLEVDTWIGE